MGAAQVGRESLQSLFPLVLHLALATHDRMDPKHDLYLSRSFDLHFLRDTSWILPKHHIVQELALRQLVKVHFCGLPKQL